MIIHYLQFTLKNGRFQITNSGNLIIPDLDYLIKLATDITDRGNIVVNNKSVRFIFEIGE